jgi:hypothetical protein
MGQPGPGSAFEHGLQVHMRNHLVLQAASTLPSAKRRVKMVADN